MSVLVALLALASVARGELAASRLTPDGSFAVQYGAPIMFTFAPVDTSGKVGTAMARFRHWVRNARGELLSDRIVKGDPSLEFPETLEPGRYRWGVEWWSADGESASSSAELLVGPRVDAWDGVPWLGGADVNEFQLQAEFPAGAEAELMIATLGFGYATVNGRDVSKDAISYSGWTNPEKRVLYRSYNVTELLGDSGKATIFVGLGCGYRCDAKGKTRFPNPEGGVPKGDSIPKVFRMQLHVGGRLVAHTGSGGWQARRGPVVDDSVYDGEVYVQGAETPWGAATQLASGLGPQGSMVAADFPGVQVVQVDTPVSITEPSPGVFVVDFGSNVAGVCRLSIPSAANVTLHHGEVLQHEHLPTVKHVEPGRVFFGNMRSATTTDNVVTTGALKGWWPRFTYRGFRYVEVTGFPGKLNADDISRLRINAALEPKARVHFGDETLQAIHEGSRGTQLSNLQLVPTDCPQRDERLGWMGDASLSAESMMKHFDYKAMATAYTDSMIDYMGDDGNLTDIVPPMRFVPGRPGDTSWTAAFIEVLTQVWKVDGDLGPARERWPSIKKQAEWIQRQYYQLSATGQPGQVLQKWAEKYGDWCPPPYVAGGKDKEVASHGFNSGFSAANTVRQAADLATALGAPEAANYTSFATTIREDFHNSWFNESTNTYDKGFMVNLVLPLALGAVPADKDAAVFRSLLSHISSKNNTWSGGIINNRHLFDLLHDRGHADLALAMLQSREYPSYGYMYFNELEPARECMWELPDAPFQGDGMNSRNHHMYSSVGSYLVRLAGLERGIGERELVARVGPRGLPHATVKLQTLHGDATWSWSWKPNGVDMRVEADIDVPVGMTAQVHLPPRMVWLLHNSHQLADAQAQKVTLPSGRHSLVAAPQWGHGPIAALGPMAHAEQLLVM